VVKSLISNPVYLEQSQAVIRRETEMGGKPTSVDVARAAGVSQTTVSRTFRGDTRVQSATREKVQAAARSLGYYPDAFARQMVTRKSGVIAVVVPDVDNPVFSSMITLLHEQMQNRGLRMMLFLERNFEQGPHDVLGSAGLPVDGVVLTSATVASSVVNEILKQDIPSILLQRDTPAAQIDRVMPDDAAGCRAIASHLADLGHTRIGMITGSPHTSSGRGRKAHFTTALNQLGHAVEDRYTRISAPHFGASRQAARELLSMPDRPTAIFCASDTIAVTVLDVAHEIGVRVPEDVSIVGFDDIDFASWSMINLTTVRQNLAAQCCTALTMLLERIDGLEAPARSITSEVELIVRGTTAPLTA
jgi:LacI family transcriptional regulator